MNCGAIGFSPQHLKDIMGTEDSNAVKDGF